jgi:choline dehydrogenase-like flavoprotein
VENLFIVGSTIFPTAGNTNPTVTLAALALRAAASINQRLSP